MTPADYTALTDELRQLIAKRLSVRARSFPEAVRRAGRRLPAPARAAAADLVALEARLAHPKLAAKTDPAHVTRAADTLRAALTRHAAGTVADRNRSLLAAEIGFRILVVLIAGLAMWQWLIPATP